MTIPLYSFPAVISGAESSSSRAFSSSSACRLNESKSCIRIGRDWPQKTRSHRSQPATIKSRNDRGILRGSMTSLQSPTACRSYHVVKTRHGGAIKFVVLRRWTVAPSAFVDLVTPEWPSLSSFTHHWFNRFWSLNWCRFVSSKACHGPLILLKCVEEMRENRRAGNESTCST